MIIDPHDPRLFRRYVQFNKDGTVASVHDFDAATVCPLPMAVEVTEITSLALDTLVIRPEDVAVLTAAVDAHAQKGAAVDRAIADLASAAAALTLVHASTRGVVAMAAATLQSGAAVKADGG